MLAPVYSSHDLRKPRNRKLCWFWLLSPMKVSSTPLNSPCWTYWLGRAEAHLADLLPIGIGRRPVADAWNFHDLGDNAVLGEGGRVASESGSCRERGCGARRAFHQLATAGLHRHELFVDMHTHGSFLPIKFRSRSRFSSSRRFQRGSILGCTSVGARLTGFKTKGPLRQVNRRPRLVPGSRVRTSPTFRRPVPEPTLAA